MAEVVFSLLSPEQYRDTFAVGCSLTGQKRDLYMSVNSWSTWSKHTRVDSTHNTHIPLSLPKRAAKELNQQQTYNHRIKTAPADLFYHTPICQLKRIPKVWNLVTTDVQTPSDLFWGPN